MDSTYTRSQRNTASFIQVPIDEKSSTAFYANNHAAYAQASTATLSTMSDPKVADIKSWSQGFERMQDARLDKQRYVMSGNKSDEVSKLALGAKLERALGRRMTGQDAAFSTKKSPHVSKKEYAVECS